jgi:hypothetical protein
VVIDAFAYEDVKEVKVLFHRMSGFDGENQGRGWATERRTAN